MQKYSVIFENEAITRIKSFIEYLRIRSRERFYDSGIHGLDEIVTNYDKSHRELQDSIFDEFERLGKLSII